MWKPILRASAAILGWEAILGLVYPNRCQLCGLEPASARSGYVGVGCRRSLRTLEPPLCRRCGLPRPGSITGQFSCANCSELNLAFESARAAVAASGAALELIHRFKYGRALWFQPLLADLLTTAAVPVLAGEGWTSVVPVPLHPVRQRHREYNQAELLARPLAQVLGIPVQTHLVRRATPTLTQTHLTRTQRTRNVRRAFQAIGNPRLDGESIIVVDDVLTTGATTDGVARVLRQQGADRVCVWSVARAILNEPPLA